MFGSWFSLQYETVTKLQHPANNFCPLEGLNLEIHIIDWVRHRSDTAAMIVMITKDNQMTNYYDTFQTFRRKNANFVGSTQKHTRDQSFDDELLLSRNIDSSQRTSVIFKAKLVLLYEIIFHDEALDIMRSVGDEYNVKTKTIFGIISNWIVVVIFNVKLRFVTLVEEQRLKPWAWHCS